MGCYTSKDISGSVISNNRISHKSYKMESAAEIKRNYFNAIGRNSWFNVIDFLSYKELNQIKNQNILAKFFRKKPMNFLNLIPKTSTFGSLGNHNSNQNYNNNHLLNNNNTTNNTSNNNFFHNHNNNPDILLINRFEKTAAYSYDNFLPELKFTNNSSYKRNTNPNNFNDSPQNLENNNFNDKANNLLNDKTKELYDIENENKKHQKESKNKINEYSDRNGIGNKNELSEEVNSKTNKTKKNKKIESELDKVLDKDNNRVNLLNLRLEIKLNNIEEDNNYLLNEEKSKNRSRKDTDDFITDANIYEINDGKEKRNEEEIENIEIETYRSEKFFSPRENGELNCFYGRDKNNFKSSNYNHYQMNHNISKIEDNKIYEKDKFNNIDRLYNEKISLSLKEMINENMKKEILSKNEETENPINVLYVAEKPEKAKKEALNKNAEINNISQENPNQLKQSVENNNNNIESEINNNEMGSNKNNQENIDFSANVEKENKTDIDKNRINTNNNADDPSNDNENKKTKIKKANTNYKKEINSNTNKFLCFENPNANVNHNFFDLKLLRNSNNLNLLRSSLANIRLNSASSGQSTNKENQNENDFSNLEIEKEALRALENLNCHLADKENEIIGIGNSDKNEIRTKKPIKTKSFGSAKGNLNNNSNNKNNSNQVVITNNYIQLYINSNSNSNYVTNNINNNNNNMNLPYTDCLTNKELELKEFQFSKNNTNRENSSLDVTPSFKLTDNDFYTNSNSDEFSNNNQINKNLDLTSTSNIFNNITNNSQIALINNNDFSNNINSMNNYPNKNMLLNAQLNQNILNNNKENFYIENYILVNSPHIDVSSSKKLNNVNNSNLNDFSASNINLTNKSNTLQFNNQIQFKDKSNSNLMINIQQPHLIQSNKNVNFDHNITNNNNNFVSGANKAFQAKHHSNSIPVNKNTLSCPVVNKIAHRRSLNSNNPILFPQGGSFSGISMAKDLKTIPDFDQISGIDLDKEKDENFLNLSNQNYNLDNFLRRVKSNQLVISDKNEKFSAV